MTVPTRSKKRSRVEKQKRWFPVLDDQGREVLDPTPLAIPLDHVPQLTLAQSVDRLQALQQHMLLRRRQEAGIEDDPADFFDEDDEYDDPDAYAGMPHQEDGFAIARDIERGLLDNPYVEKQGRKARRNPIDIIKEKKAALKKAKEGSTEPSLPKEGEEGGVPPKG